MPVIVHRAASAVKCRVAVVVDRLDRNRKNSTGNGELGLSWGTSVRHNVLGMSDFFQTGAIATLHRLGQPDVLRLERELEKFSEETPMALVLPCHIREVGTPALNRILRELKGVTYIKQIVVG